MVASNNTPLVSVVIPLFNASPFIREMLECMESQTYNNWELIIVDDGSTDDSCAIVKEFEVKDPRIILLHRPSERIKGGNTCRNIGLEQAKGEYIMWLDADDSISSECIEKRVLFLNSHSDIDFCVTPAMGFRQTIGDYTWIIGTGNCKSSDYKNFIRNLVPFQVVTNLYRKLSLKESHIKWDENLMGRQDPDFNLTVLRSGLKYDYTHNPPDYFWRIGANRNSISSQILSKSKISANIYYFNKRSSQEYENNASLSFLALYIFKILIIQKNEKILNSFFASSFFERNRIVLSKYKLISRLISRLNISNKIITLLLSLLFPYRSLVLFVRTKIFNIKTRIKAHREIMKSARNLRKYNAI